MKKRIKKLLAMLAVVILAWGAADGVAVYADDVTSCENHVYDNDCDETCNICGARREAGHKYNEYERNYHYHWKVCECGARQDSELHVYDSSTDLTCSVCGYVRHLEHDYTIPGADATYHWMECECGERTDVEKHDFVLKNDTVHHFKECTKCGTTVEKAAHVWGEGVAEGDVTTYTCTICGAMVHVTGGDTPGGNIPGGTDGGDTPGGNTPGGTDGGDTPGGNTPGGTDGGDTPGGNTPGGDSGDDDPDDPNNGGSGNGDDNGGSGNSGDSGDGGSEKEGKVDGKLLAIATGSGLTIWGGAIGGYFLYKRKKGAAGIVTDIVKDVVTDNIINKM